MTPGSTAAANPALEAALAPLSISAQEALAVIDEPATLASTYLVGSLAAGLGNAGSDVDFQVFADDDRVSGTPTMAFRGEQIIDVQYFATSAPAKAAALLPTQRVDFGSSACALGVLPPLKTLARCSRWLSAIPVVISSPPLLEPEEAERVAPSLVRSALERAVVATQVASQVSAAGLDAAVAWRVTGRALVEVMNRLRGDLYVGDKWTWAKASRGSAPPDLVHSLASVKSLDGWFEALRTLDLARVEPGAVVVHRLADATRFSLNGTEYHLVGGRQLVLTSAVERAMCGRHPESLVELLGTAIVSAEIDSQALDAALVDGSGR